MNSHEWHLYGFNFKWTAFKCLCKVDLADAVKSHWSHLNDLGFKSILILCFWTRCLLLLKSHCRGSSTQIFITQASKLFKNIWLMKYDSKNVSLWLTQMSLLYTTLLWIKIGQWFKNVLWVERNWQKFLISFRLINLPMYKNLRQLVEG